MPLTGIRIIMPPNQVRILHASWYSNIKCHPRGYEHPQTNLLVEEAELVYVIDQNVLFLLVVHQDLAVVILHIFSIVLMVIL